MVKPMFTSSSGGDLKLHCRCGADDFIACKVHVAAEGNQARITNLICPQCAKIWNVDPQGAWIEGEGQRN